MKTARRPVVVTLFAATLVAVIAFAVGQGVADGRPERGSDVGLVDVPVPASPTIAIAGQTPIADTPSGSAAPGDFELPLPDGMTIRAYSDSSPWNTKIPADPVLDRKSAAWIKDSAR